ncbi:MAG: hypothetical protein HYS09_04500 [Chloroflexi bacterium]|nr:hypothetical protein [Chloroflexota bacterium]
MALARAIPPVSAGRWLVRRALDWEDWLTFALVYFTFLTVAWNVQRAQWVEQMPSLVLVGLAGLLAGMLLARSSLPLFLAWPLGVLFGLAATFVQTLALVDGDGLRARVDAIHFRFERYFDIVSAGGIANDSLPFVVLVVALTWLAAFFWAWSLFRWHHPWLGLVPGAITLFINYIFLEQQVLVSFALYAVGALLLVSRTNLTKRLREWQAQEVTYSPFLSLSAVHLSAWAALVLLIVAWLPPATPARPLVGLWEGAAPPFQGLAEQFVRLAGPLRVSRVVPVHDYTSLFPLQGSVDLREDDLLTVRFTRSSRSGPLLLRGAVYDEYTPGGWKAAPRVEIELPQGLSATVRPRDIVRVEVEVVGKSVVGSVIFTPGHPLGTDVAARARVPASGLTNRYAVEPAATLPDIAVVVPARPLSEGESYTVAGLIRDVPPAALRRASADEGLYPSKARYGRYPYWISELYLRLPSDLPGRVHALAFDLTSAHDNGYDKAIAVQRYLRSFPVDYEIDRAPPGQDAVDYFLFDARRGYFDYHASAMVVLLRAAGVPARLAVGFVVDADSFDAESGSYTISERDAYAWPEVYFPDYGWIEFNPTPDRPPVLRPGAASAPLGLGAVGGRTAVLPAGVGEDRAPGFLGRAATAGRRDGPRVRPAAGPALPLGARPRAPGGGV